MAIYCDDPAWTRWHGASGHLIADTLAELHEIARQLDLDSRHYMGHAVVVHYQLPASKRDEAIALGAQPLDRGTFMARVRGLTQPSDARPRRRDAGKDPVPRSRRRRAGQKATLPEPQQTLF